MKKPLIELICRSRIPEERPRKGTMVHRSKKAYERERYQTPPGQIVQFDTDGITDQCPRGCRLWDECLVCPYYIGTEGFVVWCSYTKK